MHVLLSTPLLKVPLLLGNAVFTYHGMTPPMQRPSTKEQLRFAAPDLVARTARLQRALTAASKYVLCTVSIAEGVLLLAHGLPNPYSDRTVASFLPAINDHALTSLHITSLSAAACVLGIAGGIIRIWCYRTLGRFFTWQTAVRDGHQLITHGPYAVVRHPSYAGWLLLIAGNFMLLASPGSFFVESGLSGSVVGRVAAIASFGYCMFSTVNVMRRVAKEDAVLRREFGAQWEDWARRTPYRLVPFVY